MPALAFHGDKPTVVAAVPRFTPVLTLSAGGSTFRTWRFEDLPAGTLVRVGSDPECTWRIDAEGVALWHLELHWDGEQVWLSDIHAPTWADDEPAAAWTTLRAHTPLHFGSATIEVRWEAVRADESGVHRRADVLDADDRTIVSRR